MSHQHLSYIRKAETPSTLTNLKDTTSTRNHLEEGILTQTQNMKRKLHYQSQWNRPFANTSSDIIDNLIPYHPSNQPAPEKLKQEENQHTRSPVSLNLYNVVINHLISANISKICQYLLDPCKVYYS